MAIFAECHGILCNSQVFCTDSTTEFCTDFRPLYASVLTQFHEFMSSFYKFSLSESSHFWPVSKLSTWRRIFSTTALVQQTTPNLTRSLRTSAFLVITSSVLTSLPFNRATPETTFTFRKWCSTLTGSPFGCQGWKLRWLWKSNCQLAIWYNETDVKVCRSLKYRVL